MKKKIVILTLILLFLSGCGEFWTGKKVTTTDPVTGEKTITYEDAPIDAWTAAIAGLVPTLGVGVLALGRIAKRAARAKDGVMDANKQAIEEADWSKINSKEAFKAVLKAAQDSHDDGKLIRSEYKKWKKGDVAKQIKALS